MTKNEAYVKFGESVTQFNGAFDFFYDETNNIRKLLLVSRDYDENKVLSNLNSEDNPFIVGGVFTPKGLQFSEGFQKTLEQLLRKLGKQPTQKELKFKHLAKGGYPKVLTSKGLGNVFKWMMTNKVYPHFQILDVYHWSLVDIVENQIAYKIYDEIVGHNVDKGLFPLAHLKGILVDMALFYKIDFFRDMHSVGFPNIDNKNKQEFINILLKYTTKYMERSKNKQNMDDILYVYCLEQILKEYSKTNDDSFFLLRDAEHELIKEFTLFYQNRIKAYPDSYHTFDEEKNVISSIEEQWGDPKNKNYEFVISESNSLVQISDILLGFMRVLHNYLEKINIRDISIDFSYLPEKSKKSLALFFQLYVDAVFQSEGTFHYIGSIYNFKKFTLLKDLALQS